MPTLDPDANATTVGTAVMPITPSPMTAWPTSSLPSLTMYRKLVQVLEAAQRDLRPVYVDLGAEHPTADSLTQMLYERGWRGVNVEPVPAYLHYLKNQRPNDRNVQSLSLADALVDAQGGLLRLHLGRAVTVQDVVQLMEATPAQRPAVICVEHEQVTSTPAPWAVALTQTGFLQVTVMDAVSVWVDPARAALHQALSAALAADVTTASSVPAFDKAAHSAAVQAASQQAPSTVQTAALPAPRAPARTAKVATVADPVPSDDARQLLRRRVLAMLQEGRVLDVLKSRVRRVAVAAVRQGLLTNAAGLRLMAQLERIPRLRPYVQRLTRSQQGLTPVSVALLQQMKEAIAAAQSSKPAALHTSSEPSMPTMPSAANASAAISSPSKP